MDIPTQLKKNKPSLHGAQYHMDRAINSGRKQVSKLVDKFNAGKLSADEWKGKMYDVLLDRHTRAVFLGRHRAGDTAPPEKDDKEFAKVVMEEQAKFLDKFADDIVNDRLSEAQIANRAQYYVSRVVGTANDVFVLASDEQSQYWWTVEALERSCQDCPEIARNSPYYWDELPTKPGMCETQCHSNCNCRIRRDDGVESFRLTN